MRFCGQFSLVEIKGDRTAPSQLTPLQSSRVCRPSAWQVASPASTSYYSAGLLVIFPKVPLSCLFLKDVFTGYEVVRW